MNKWLSRLGLDWFLLAIIAMVLLGKYLPGPGLITEPVSLEELAGYGVSGIFFFYGLKLSPEKLKNGLSNWKIHVAVQLTTFLLFPLLILVIKPLFSSPEMKDLWLGIFYLAALPSTVSSSVVMVSIARGNIPAAIFNASISSLIGIFMTPLWVGFFIAADTGGLDFSDVIIKLCIQVLVPLIAGMLLNSRYGTYAERYKTPLKIFDQVVILIIIYTSFCKSFALDLFRDLSTGEIIALGGGLLLLFFVVIFITGLLGKWMGLEYADQITLMFCGSKKSLVHGTVMSKVLFAGSTAAGVVLLPLMLYHALQLIAASVMAQRFEKQAK